MDALRSRTHLRTWQLARLARAWQFLDAQPFSDAVVQPASSEDSLSSTSAGTDESMPGMEPFTLTRCRSCELFARKTKDCFEQQAVMKRWKRRRARSLTSTWKVKPAGTQLTRKVKPAGTSQASTLPPVSGTQRGDADADSKRTAVRVLLPDLFTHVFALPGVHSTILSCLAWFLHGQTNPVLHAGYGRLRQCSSSIWGISRYDESLFAELGKRSCRCGRCEARWLTNGWVCRP